MLRFWTRLFGPVFAKEMVETARRMRYYINRVLLLLVVLMIGYVAWEENVSRRNVLSTKIVSHAAGAVFTATVIIQFGSIFLFIPVFLCGVIAGEREARSLDLLFTTTLKAREIVLGKLMSRLVLAFQLILVPLPVISLISLFGGIDPGKAMGSVVAMLFAAIYAGAHSIYFSTKSKSPLGAMIRSYWWMALWILALPSLTIGLFAASSSNPNGNPFRMAMALVGCVNPASPLFCSIFPELSDMLSAMLSSVAIQIGPLRLDPGRWYFPLLLVIPFCWSCLLIWLAVRDVRQEPQPLFQVPHWMNPVFLAKTTGKACYRGAVACFFGNANWLDEKVSTQVANPLIVRSMFARVYDREGHLGNVQFWGWWIAAAFLTMLGLEHVNNLRDDETAMVFLTLTWVATTLIVVLISSTSLAGDRRRGLLDILLTTPTTPQQYIDGTLTVVFKHVRAVLMLVCALYLLFFFTQASPPLGLLFSLITGILVMLMLATVGITCSLAADSVPTPLIMTIGFAAFIVVGVPCFFVFEDASVFIAWLFCLVAFFVTSSVVKRYVSAVTVGLRLAAVHVFLAVICTLPSLVNVRNSELFLFVINPAPMLISVLHQQSRRTEVIPGLGVWWVLPYLGYWLAIILTILWARRWAIRDFDRLTGRIEQLPEPIATPAVSTQSTQPLTDKLFAR